MHTLATITSTFVLDTLCAQFTLADWLAGQQRPIFLRQPMYHSGKGAGQGARSSDISTALSLGKSLWPYNS